MVSDTRYQIPFESARGTYGDWHHYKGETTMAKITTVEQALNAVKKDGARLKDVPEELKTVEVFFEAVKANGRMLEDVPENLKTAEMCLKAVNYDGRTLEYVPEKLKTLELCLIAAKNDPYYLESIMSNVPKALQKEVRRGLEIGETNITTAEEALAAVKDDGKALKNVPEKLKTAEMCLEAVKDDGRALEYVPEKLKTEEMCLEAVKQQSYYAEYHGSVSPEIFAFKYVPEKFKTAEICLEAVKQKENTWAWSEVPDNARTAEICLLAVKQHGSRLKDVPWGRLNLTVPEKVELCLEVVKNLSAPPSHLYPDWDRFSFVPEELRDEVRRRYEKGD